MCANVDIKMKYDLVVQDPDIGVSKLTKWRKYVSEMAFEVPIGNLL